MIGAELATGPHRQSHLRVNPDVCVAFASLTKLWPQPAHRPEAPGRLNERQVPKSGALQAAPSQQPHQAADDLVQQRPQRFIRRRADGFYRASGAPPIIAGRLLGAPRGASRWARGLFCETAGAGAAAPVGPTHALSVALVAGVWAAQARPCAHSHPLRA